MKIFGWMHRKFQQNVDYGLVADKKGVFADESQKVEYVEGTCEREMDALLLEHESLVDVFNGWQNGILTIGTFGVHQFQGFQEEEEEYEDNEEEQEKIEAEEEELNPVAIKALKEELEMVFGSNPTRNMEMRGQEFPAADDNPLWQFLESPDFHALEKNDEKKRKGERITLADLFSADAAGKTDSGGFPPDKIKKSACRAKHGLSFAKKLMGRKGEESGPRAKLHRMVTRMLKKKIHPEVELQIQPGVNGTKTKNWLGDCVANGPHPGVLAYDSDDNVNESVSLLRGSSQRRLECC